jgi:hypothetical protein
LWGSLYRRLTSSRGRNTSGQNGSSQPQPSSAAVPSQQQQSTFNIFWIAFIIIFASFVFIAVMLYIHYISLQNVLNSKNITNNNVTTVKDLIDHVNTSNQTIFNMLLPVFGAWVGVVVAFYFGNEQAQRTQQAFKDQSKDQHDLINHYPQMKKNFPQLKCKLYSINSLKLKTSAKVS